VTGSPLLGIIRVLSTDDPDSRDAHGRAITAEHGVRTVSRCIPDQPHGIHDPASHARAVPKIVTIARDLATEGASAVVISCAADPGLAEARAAVAVPVWGAGSSAAAVATAVGGRVGVLGITEDVPAAMAEVLGDRLVAHRRPDGVTRTTDLPTPHGRAAALHSVGELISAGAQVILFACTGLTTIDLAAAARSRWNIPVIDAVRATGALAALATR
jgi:Asp/Glu/hydantoin racemase